MTVKIEIAIRKKPSSQKRIEKVIWRIVQDRKVPSGLIIKVPSNLSEELNVFQDEIHSVTFSQVPQEIEKLSLQFIYYSFSDQGPELESLDSHESEQVAASVHWMLPNDGFFGMWEALIYEDSLKENLLDFAETMLLFSDKNVDQNIISINRLILLHGLPGTGKTSLAKALAQKLSIQMNSTYQYTHLFEINSHSLFSKWFSESGKLVMKMFAQIQEVIEMESSLVCVLIDEVESIAYARGNISNNEPSDSVRVVNSVLTQLDRIKKHPNCLVIATSNLTSSIDPAFIDRADIVTYIGQPSLEAVLKILSSTTIELVEKGILHPEDNEVDFFNAISSGNFNSLQFKKDDENRRLLKEICQDAEGVSGRSLRKMPFIAHALYLKKGSTSINEFLRALKSAIQSRKHSNENIGQFNKIM